MKTETIIPIPGADSALVVVRDAKGNLCSIHAAGREYLRVEEGIRVYDNGFVRTSDVDAPAGLLRHVQTGESRWVEAYLRDAAGLPVRVDGVEIQRDERGRVTACIDAEGSWLYRYHDEYLVEIVSPSGVRRIGRDTQGRPVSIEEGGVCRSIAYDAGLRSDVGEVPPAWNRDDEGRLWSITGANGRVEAFFIWDGFHCLARVDGAPGEPLAAVFSLDGTGTPVRVIARDGVTRIPRDAFGEGLLACAKGVPGLFGGARHGEFFYYSARALDPRLGSYNAPDPWHGGQDDPRRAGGYRGTLLVERPVAGCYAVCQYDPIAFVDPTGTIAWYYLLTTLTWAFPNNLLTWVGLEGTINFWGSLFGGQIGRFFSGAHIHSERFGMGALQLDGIMAAEGQVFTTQHIVWAKREHFESHAEISGFAPDGPITPTYYGTMLRVVPEHADAFLLRGSRPGTNGDPRFPQFNSGVIEWTRAGGEAEAFAPGLLSPRFPAGGFHFAIQAGIHGPMRGVLTELEPGADVATGTVDDKLLLTLPGIGHGLAEGALVLIANAANVADIVPTLSVEESGGATQVRLNERTLAAGTTGLRLRRLGPMQSSEVLPRGTQNTHLNVVAGSAPYLSDDALRLLDGGVPVGAALVSGFEARLTLDAALPGTLRSPIAVFALAPSGPVRGAELTADASVLTFAVDPVPAEGDFLNVTRAGTTISVVVIPGETGRNRRVDRSLAALGAAGAVSWQQLVRGSAHGARRGAVEGAAQLTYAPIVRGSAPASGFVGVEDAGGTLAARRIASLAYDSMVLAGPLPAGPAQFTVERYVQEGNALAVTSAVLAAVLALAQNVNFSGVSLRLLQIGTQTLPAGVLVAAGFTVAGESATLPYRTPSAQPIQVGEAVVVNSGGGPPAAAVVRAIEMTVELDRDMTLAASDLRLVQLVPAGPIYDAERADVRTVVVAPLVNGVRVQMPRFFIGEIVLVTAGAADRLYRVADVAGTTLSLEGDAEIPAAPGALAIQRVLPGDPETGGQFLGIDGVPIHQAATGTTRYARFRFWRNQALAGVTLVGIVSNGTTLPARVSPASYDAIQPNAALPMQLDVQPTIAGAAVTPTQFQVDEAVIVEWRSGTAASDECTITAVSGARIDLVSRTGGAGIPGGATDITVRRMPVLTLRFTVAPAAPGASIEVHVLPVTGRHFAATFTQESPNALVLPGGAAGLAVPSQNLVVVIGLNETAVRVAGELNSGTVKAPDDPENWEYDRRQALVEHELRHAQQYNWFGPLWFTLFPMWILDTVMAAATDVELPAYSAFVPGRLLSNDADVVRRLAIPDMQGIPFSAGDTVQIYRASTHNEVKLGTQDGTTFDISGSVTISNGDIFVRRRASGQGTAYDIAFGILRFLTPASLMNVTMTLTYGSVYQLIGRIIHLISRTVNSGTLLEATVEDNGAVAVLASAPQVRDIRNESRLIVRIDDGKAVRSVDGAITEGRIRLDAPILVSSGRDVKVSREGGNQQFNAKVEGNGSVVKLNNASDASAFSGVTRVEIMVGGDTTVVRSIDPPGDDGRISFRTPLPVSTGRIKVAPYETMTPGTLWHWNSYYPATVDPNRLATVELHAVGSDSLTLRPRDRVRVLYDENDSFGFTTTVTAVNGNTIDLEEAFPNLPANDGSELIVRLAKIGRDDPTGFIDQRLVDDLYDAGWVRWLTDPFGQIHYTAQQRDHDSFWTHFARVGRYLLGTSAWGMMPPAFGFYFWDGLFLSRTKDAPYLAFIEQDASEHSGDLYTSIGRLYGEGVRSSDGPTATMVVGDIALYWFWPGGRFSILPMGNRQDAPGVHLPAEPCAMPFVTNESGADAPNNGSEPNNNAQAGAVATEPGHGLPDVFFAKSTADPREPAATGARRFNVGMRGWVPMEPRIQRTMANYVAFTRPTTGNERHRMTIRTGLDNPAADRHAQDKGKQVIFYNVTVQDVTATVNGVAVAEGGTVRLLRTQRARVEVSGEGALAVARRYRVTVRRPADGPVLRAPEDLVLEARDQNGAGEPVEISRFYHFDPVARHFENGALRGRGMHLATDVDIPVRTISVDVVDTLPVLAALPARPDFTVYAEPVQALRPGSEVVVLVASSVMLFNHQVQYASAPAPAATIDPVVALADATGAASAELLRFLGLGRTFSLRLGADDPPEERASVRFEVTVGDPTNQSVLSVVVPIEGHFLANAPGGIYQVPRGGTLVLNCASLAGGGVTPLADVQVTRTNGTPPPLVGADPELTFAVAGSLLTITAHASASTGLRRLLVVDAADPANRARRTVAIV